jgi:hypothetical protein
MRAARPAAAQLDRGLAAGWGLRPPPVLASAPVPERPRMRLVTWKPTINKGTLRGFATVELPIGLKLVDCPVFVGPSGPWAALPAKPPLNKGGRQRTDANGKRAFGQLLEWRNRNLSDRFSAALVDLVRREHPEALEDRS